jgi:hypothetical protein
VTCSLILNFVDKIARKEVLLARAPKSTRMIEVLF